MSVETVSKDVLIRNRSENACSYCRQHFSCGILKSALMILTYEINKSEDPRGPDLLASFHGKLQQFGYSYPQAQRFCWLHDKKTIVQGLIAEAEDLIMEVRAWAHQAEAFDDKPARIVS